MKWKDKVLKDVLANLTDNLEWHVWFNEAVSNSTASIHLAVFNEPFLSMIFSGEKTIESRFSINKLVPFNRIEENDIVLLKKTAGPIQGICHAKRIKYFSNLNPKKVSELERIYGTRIGWNVDPEFLGNKIDARFLTLFEITDLVGFGPINAKKNDRTAWSILNLSFKNTLFDILN